MIATQFMEIYLLVLHSTAFKWATLAVEVTCPIEAAVPSVLTPRSAWISSNVRTPRCSTSEPCAESLSRAQCRCRTPRRGHGNKIKVCTMDAESARGKFLDAMTCFIVNDAWLDVNVLICCLPSRPKKSWQDPLRLSDQSSASQSVTSTSRSSYAGAVRRCGGAGGGGGGGGGGCAT